MNALPCTLPVEVHDRVFHAICRDTAMFMKATTRSWCHMGLPKL